jgi:hypothetical protein
VSCDQDVGWCCEQAGDSQSAANLELLDTLNCRILKAEELQVNINNALRGGCTFHEAKTMLADMEVRFRETALIVLHYAAHTHWIQEFAGTRA